MVLKNITCPGCQSSKVEDFFVVKNAPVQSVVTIQSYDEAIAIPKKDISLAFCNDCGLIFNSSFDTSIEYYTNGYEDQQGFSPAFNMFITGVSNKFIDKYEVREKDIVDIGCGKGDFINLLCDLGNNRGIGIDPAFVPGRLKSNPNVSFLKEFYSEEHGNLSSDVITCRHTLEHIHDIDKFIKMVRRSINGNEDVTVFIEVPGIVRILNIHAFWDIFYEHCNYFSPGSLSRLFKMNGFEILDTYLEYDDQYLFLEATPIKDISSAVHPLEESVKTLRGHVDDFVIQINEQLRSWRKRLLKMKEQNEKVAIWGGGSKAVGFLTHFDDLGVIKHVVDINPHMQGNFIPGIGIQYVSPVFLREYKPDTIIIMNGIYENEIRKMLTDIDLYPKLICL